MLEKERASRESGNIACRLPKPVAIRAITLPERNLVTLAIVLPVGDVTMDTRLTPVESVV